jgi:hypothetical protein
MYCYDLMFYLCEVETNQNFTAVPFHVMVKSMIMFSSIISAYCFDNMEHLQTESNDWFKFYIKV